MLQDVNPPDQVKASFNEVNQAEQERETKINQAQSEYNKVIFRSQGEAEKTVSTAEGYALDRVNRAQGEAARASAATSEERLAKEAALLKSTVGGAPDITSHGYCFLGR